jgi:hypothetical protein
MPPLSAYRDERLLPAESPREFSPFHGAPPLFIKEEKVYKKLYMRGKKLQQSWTEKKP